MKYVYVMEKFFSIELHKAVLTNDLVSLEKILNQHCNIDEKNDFGYTALHMSVEFENGVLEKLIEHGADINTTDGYWYPIHSASYCASYKNINILLNCGINVNLKGEFDRTALHIIADTGTNSVITEARQIKCFEILIQNNIDIDNQDAFCQTALHITCLKNKYNLTKFLIDCQANTYIKDIYSFKPIDYALLNNNSELVSLFG